MMPGGHLATSLALSGVAYASTGSLEAALGCFAGGFLIDLDHYGDYLIFEKQWRRPGPLNFLRYYFAHCPKKIVLPLHSAELMIVLFLMILVHPWPLLVGYWLGALMHLVFDILVNGDYVLKRRFRFYRSEEHTSELQSLRHLVCRLLLEIKKHADTDKRYAS